MQRVDFQSMSLAELWSAHENVHALLVEKIEAELHAVQGRLARVRRPYRQVRPKFRNPENPSETWGGRGHQPKWVRDLLAAGMSIDEFRVEHETRSKPHRPEPEFKPPAQLGSESS